MLNDHDLLAVLRNMETMMTSNEKIISYLQSCNVSMGSMAVLLVEASARPRTEQDKPEKDIALDPATQALIQDFIRRAR